MRLLLLFLIMSFITLNLSGCVSMQKQPIESQILEPSTTLRFSDVPVPDGFKIITEKSFILESAGVRAGVLKYRGKADIEDVVRFYKTQMTVYNWGLLNVLEYGERMLNFERENEVCVITIEPKRGRVDISVSLAPKSPITGPKEQAASEQPIVEKIK